MYSVLLAYEAVSLDFLMYSFHSSFRFPTSCKTASFRLCVDKVFVLLGCLDVFELTPEDKDPRAVPKRLLVTLRFRPESTRT